MSEINNKPRPVLALQPGILVGLKSEVRGGVRYYTEELQGAEKAATIDDVGAVLPSEGASVTARKSAVVVEDKAEHERATATRNAARSKISKICTLTPFGLLCPRAREADLDAAIVEAESDVAAFNRGVREANGGVQRTRVDVFAIKGYIADNDEKAARGIASEIAELLDNMKAGVEARDPEAIRAACRKAQALQSMIDEQAGERVSVALAAARSSAREIAKTIKDKGHADAILVTDGNKRILDELRKSFTVLDLPSEGEIQATGEALAPVATAEIDLPPVEGEGATAEAPPAPAAPEIDPDPNPEDVDAAAAVDRDVAAYRDAGELVAGAPDDAPAFFDL